MARSHRQRNGKREYTLAEVEAARERVRNGETQADVSRSIGTNKTTVHQWIHRVARADR